ncbi:XdhC family protein [Cohnella faecalis]|uniref:XdhC family protein n=1 Tax=Cohnella faecalis TaxID=2315694 RepID=UPI0036226309
MGETADLLEWVQGRGAGRPSVLATIISVEGHAYRKEGAAMILAVDGETVGHVSPGCLEDDLKERVAGLYASGNCEIVAYNMRPEEDAVWGEAIGCGGTVRILLEPIVGALAEALRRAASLVEAGHTAVLARTAVPGGGMEYGIEELQMAEKGERSEKGRPFFISVFEPRARLVVFGAGADSEALCAVAARIGFRVFAADWRSSRLEAMNRCGMAVAIGRADRISAELALGPADYVVLCSHQMQRDREMLEEALTAGVGYIGIMGSRSRVRALLEGLPMSASIHAPVGLSIGAAGADEIAISIAAELIAERRGRRPSGRGSANAYRGTLFGGGERFPDGETEARFGACSR